MSIVHIAADLCWSAADVIAGDGIDCQTVVRAGLADVPEPGAIRHHWLAIAAIRGLIASVSEVIELFQ